jgi:hypothetical protein
MSMATMMTKPGAAAAALAGAIALAPAARAGESTTQYALADFSFYFSGCFEACACPPLTLAAEGTFRLELVTFTPTYRSYAIEDVHWRLGGEYGPLVTGTGSYERFLDGPEHHRLALDVEIADGAVIHYDSGAYPGGAEFPVIEAIALRYGSSCFDEGFTIRGLPLPQACPGDLDRDGEIGFGDLLALLAAWGPCDACDEDLDASGDVGFGDLLIVLGSWGGCT